MLIATTPPYQIQARSEGEPALGSGAIYPIGESDVVVPDRAIPEEWPRVYGMDVGWNCTAVVWGASDPAPSWTTRGGQDEGMEGKGFNSSDSDVYSQKAKKPRRKSSEVRIHDSGICHPEVQAGSSRSDILRRRAGL